MLQHDSLCALTDVVRSLSGRRDSEHFPQSREPRPRWRGGCAYQAGGLGQVLDYRWTFCDAQPHAPVTEWEAIGRDRFLDKYRARDSHKYFLVEGGNSYDAKALVHAAYAIEHPDDDALVPGDFPGDRAAIADPLRDMGFWVEGADASHDQAEPPLGKDPSKYVAAAPRIVGALDRAVAGTARREQSLLRGALGLYSAADADCALCGRSLPTELLVAAHIKPRSLCTRDERVDVRHVGMAACLMGCDALFEKGLVAVDDDGRLLHAPGLERTNAVHTYVMNMPTRLPLTWLEGRREYFRWHRQHTFEAPNSV